MLFAVLVNRYRNSLVVCEKHHISPFFNKRRYKIGCLLAELQLPAVITSEFIGLFKLSEDSVSCKYNVNSGFDNIFKQIKEPAELFLFVYIAVAVTEILDTLFVVLIADRLDAKLFRPVYRINYKRGTRLIELDILNLALKQLPRCRFIKTGNVHFLCTTLGVDE